MEMDKDQELNDLFNQARTEAPEVGFENMKANFLAQMESPSMDIPTSETSNLFTIKTWIIMITTLITTGIAVAYLGGFFHTTTPSLDNEINKEPISALELHSNKLAQIEITETEFSFLDYQSTQVYHSEFSQEELAETVTEPETVEPEELKEVNTIFKDSVKTKEEYRFPILSENEKKMYAKQKARMIKQWKKMDKEVRYIPMLGKFLVENDSVVFNPFFMSGTEVTNLEYRTFLFDLLEQSRRTDFMEAKPDQSLWAKDYPDFNQPMVELYFSHPAYNDYPVNNISRKGAELYCEWLTTAVINEFKSKEMPQHYVIRLPYAEEWEYAARGGLKKSAYPWGGPYAHNAQGCYLANFNPEGESPGEDGAMQTAKVSSYSPNDYGLYCMSGNVAEMVYYGKDKG
jgi:hypothetical protein